MIAQFCHGVVLVAIIEDGAVVTAEHDQRVSSQAQPIDRRSHLADGPVEFHDAVSPGAQSRGALKPFMRDPWHVDVVRRQQQKEWPGFRPGMGLDPANTLAHPGIGQILVTEPGLCPSRGETDPADAIVNRIVVTDRPVHPQLVTIIHAVWMIHHRLRITHPQRVGRIEVLDDVILDDHLRHTVVGGGEQEAVVEAVFVGPWHEPAIPVGPRTFFAQSEVPLADHGSGVSGVFEHRGEGRPVRLDDGGRVGGCDPGAWPPKRILPGEEGIAGRRAGRCRAVATRETNSLTGEAVDVGCLHRGCPVARHIPPAEIIGHDHDHVGPSCRDRGGVGGGGDQGRRGTPDEDCRDPQARHHGRRHPEVLWLMLVGWAGSRPSLPARDH